MAQTTYHPGPVDPSLLTRQDEHRSTLVWDGMETDFRLRTNFKSYWDVMRSTPHPPALVEAIRSAGLFGVFQIGMMTHDAGLISAFVERWRPETHTFHFSFGEATITLEDVYYILGLPIDGYPVFTEEGAPDASLVLELLGVDPNIVDEERGTVSPIQKGGINIPWLINNFADCGRLEYDRDDYEAQLLFHRRAHILLILGSLFSHSSGNRLPVRLLYYVRDLDRVSQYSWGSACLAYLYKHLCDASIGKKKELCGSMTLLQVWIYERFPGLCPTHRQSYLIQHPRALRFVKIPLKYANVPFNSSRGTRFELDSMSESGFKWRPYVDSAPEAMSITDRDRELMSAQCPLIFERVVEWCYTDRVTRQFGFLQVIPRSSPLPGHSSFHGPTRQWPMSYDQVIQHWYSRHHDLISPSTYTRTRVPTCSDQYFPWYETVTRRYIINPRIWAAQQGMQATQGHLPIIVEGISRALHEMTESGIADDDYVVDETIQVLRSTLDVTGFPALIDRPPPPPAPTRQRRGHTLITPPPPPLPHVPAQGWDVPWPNPTVEEVQERYLGPGWDGPAVPQSSHGHAFTATHDRQVKGKERLCGTEGMCGKKKKKGKGPRLG